MVRLRPSNKKVNEAFTEESIKWSALLEVTSLKLFLDVCYLNEWHIQVSAFYYAVCETRGIGEGARRYAKLR